MQLVLAKQNYKHYFLTFLKTKTCLSLLIACFFFSYRVKNTTRRKGRAQFQCSWNICHWKYNCWISEEYRQGNHKDPGASWSRFHYQGGVCECTNLQSNCKCMQHSLSACNNTTKSFSWQVRNTNYSPEIIYAKKIQTNENATRLMSFLWWKVPQDL